MKKVTFLFWCCLMTTLVYSQKARFSVSVSIDSLLMGNYTEVEFKLENISGKNFQAPSFEGFQVVGGPSQSSSYSMINGAVNQSQTFTYYLEPLDVGNYYLEVASVETEDGYLETEPILIVVVPNPEGIKQKPSRTRSLQFDLFEPIPDPTPPEANPKKRKPRKKRRIYRI